MTQTILAVGPGQQFATISAAIVAANQMGGNADIRIAAGTYANDGGYLSDITNNVTIEGVDGMVTLVQPVSAGGKAAIVVGGDHIVLKNLSISGSTNPYGTAAAIYDDRGTLTLDNVRLYSNQLGFVADPDPKGSVTIENSEIDHNSTGNIVIGDVAQFTLTDSYVHDVTTGDEVESRAENSVITGNRIFDGIGATALSVDLPNGGGAIITDNVIEQGAQDQNPIVAAYGEKGNLHAGHAVTFANNTIVNDAPLGAGSLWLDNGGTITGSGNTAWNLADLGAGVDPASVTALARRPTLDTSSGTRTPTGTTLHPTISFITGIPYTGIRLTGTSSANSTVTITDTVGGKIHNLGTTTASATGAWSFFSASSLGHIDLAAVHDYSVSALDAAGNLGAMPGALVLADTGNDNLIGTVGATDIFAIMSFLGSDVIYNFQPASTDAATHDIIDLSGRGITSFSQVQALLSGSGSAVLTIANDKTVTLFGIASTALTAADFRFS